MKLKKLVKSIGGAGLASACLVGALLLPKTVLAADDGTWPTGPVQVIMHTQAGGSADVFMRTLAKSLGPEIGQPVIVINSPGGAGATQMSRVRSAKPDGQTLGINTLSHFTGMLTNLKGAFSIDDFSWIASTQEDVHVLFSKEGSSITDVKKLIKKAKNSNGKLSIGGFGPVGSTQNIAISMLENATNTDLEWVAFNGTPDIIAAVMGGHVDVGISNLSALKSFIDANRIQGIGVIADKRLDPMPKVPTLAEQGIDIDTSWIQVRGVFGPAGIPEATQQQIADAFHKAMKSKDYQTYARNSGITDSWMGPEQYTQFAKNISKTAQEELDKENKK